MIIANKELLDDFVQSHANAAKPLNDRLITREQYDKVKAEVEQLITAATQEGKLEPDMDNDYTQKIASLSKLMADYEDEYLDILPLRQNNHKFSDVEKCSRNRP